MLIITGMGRCGTSFVADICKEGGYDPGGVWEEEIRAGWEHDRVTRYNQLFAFHYGMTRRPFYMPELTTESFPKVVKDPRFVSYQGVLETWLFARDDFDVLWLNRDLDEIYDSRKKAVEAGKVEGWGISYPEDKTLIERDHFKKIAHRRMGHARLMLDRAHVQVTEFDYNSIVADGRELSDYLTNNLGPCSEDWYNVWARVVRLS